MVREWYSTATVNITFFICGWPALACSGQQACTCFQSLAGLRVEQGRASTYCETIRPGLPSGEYPIGEIESTFRAGKPTTVFEGPTSLVRHSKQRALRIAYMQPVMWFSIPMLPLVLSCRVCPAVRCDYRWAIKQWLGTVGCLIPNQ